MTEVEKEHIVGRLDRAPRRRLREEREYQACASGQALRQAKNPKRQPVPRTEERHEKVGGSMLDRALAQPFEWVCEWKVGKGRRVLWAERCRCMDGMAVGAVTAGGRGDWLRQGVRVGCIVVRRRQEEEVLGAEQARDVQGGRVMVGHGECRTRQGAGGESKQGSIGAEGGDGGASVGSGGVRQADGSTARREGPCEAGTSGQRRVGGDRTSKGWGSVLWAETDPQFLATYEAREPGGAE